MGTRRTPSRPLAKCAVHIARDSEVLAAAESAAKPPMFGNCALKATLRGGTIALALLLVGIPGFSGCPSNVDSTSGLSLRSAHAQEVLSPGEMATRLQSRHRHTQEMAVEELAREGKRALPWIEKVLLNRSSRYRLRLGVTEALNKMGDLRASELSEQAIGAVFDDTAHHSHALRRESRRFLVKHASPKVERVFDQILEEVRDAMHPGRPVSPHAALLGRTGLDLLFERGMREIVQYTNPGAKGQQHFQNGLAALKKAWRLRSLASAGNRYLFPKALYGWGYALEERAWIERDPNDKPQPHFVRAAQEKYQEFMGRVLKEDPEHEYPYREHLYHADRYREDPTVRGTLHALAWRVLSLTSTFESSRLEPENFAALAGDFDGQGMSFGALQWNIGQKTLQPLLIKIAQEHPHLIQEIFHQDYPTFTHMLQQDRKEQLRWARSIQNLRHFTINEPWRGFFKVLAGRYEFQKIQVLHANRLFRDAVKLCEEYGLRSERCVALMFDIKVQDGGIHHSVKAKINRDFQSLKPTGDPALDELGRLRIVANRVAEAASRRWIEDVRRRKLVVANGEGVLHGLHYTLDERGITLHDFRTHKPLDFVKR